MPYREFYATWFIEWGKPVRDTSASWLVSKLQAVVDTGASVNLYVSLRSISLAESHESQVSQPSVFRFLTGCGGFKLKMQWSQ